jgi:hypothetical protein
MLACWPPDMPTASMMEGNAYGIGLFQAIGKFALWSIQRTPTEMLVMRLIPHMRASKVSDQVVNPVELPFYHYLVCRLHTA